MRRPFSAKCSNPSPWLAVILDGGGLGLDVDKAARADPRGPKPGSRKRVHLLAVNRKYEINTQMAVKEMC